MSDSAESTYRGEMNGKESGALVKLFDGAVYYGSAWATLWAFGASLWWVGGRAHWIYKKIRGPVDTLTEL